MEPTGTVHDRIDHTFSTVGPTQVALGLALVAVATFVVLFWQQPMVHDAMHNFRHVAGVTCH